GVVAFTVATLLAFYAWLRHVRRERAEEAHRRAESARKAHEDPSFGGFPVPPSTAQHYGSSVLAEPPRTASAAAAESNDTGEEVTRARVAQPREGIRRHTPHHAPEGADHRLSGGQPPPGPAPPRKART